MSEFIPGDPELRDMQGNPQHPYGWLDVDTYLPMNPSGYSSADFDQACRTAMGLLPGEVGYLQSHQAVQEIFAQDLPVIPLFMRIKMTATNNCLYGYAMDTTADSDTWDIEEYDIQWKCR
jgi:peptide/nickel transport system substrate-binding protein